MVHIVPRAVSEPAVQSLLARHRRFLHRSPEQSFLQSWGVFAASEPVQLPQPDGSTLTSVERLEPRHIHPTLMVDAFEQWPMAQEDLVGIAKHPTLAFPGLGDLMPFSQAFSKIPWLEAMLGCPIEMTEGQIWVKPYDGDLEAFAARSFDLQGNPWFERYLAFLDTLQARLGDRYPVTTNTLLRGPSDLVAHMMGIKEACIAWIDRPDLMTRMLRVCTDVILGVIEGREGVVGPVLDGQMSGFGIWAPGPVTRTQADHSSLLSPAMYEQQILPFDREVIRACPHCIFHIHNNGLHVAPALARVPALDVIEVMVDPYPTGDRKAYEVAMLQEIQAHKPLLLDVNLPDMAEAAWLLEQLSPRGLCFNARFAPDAYQTERAKIPESPLWTLTG
jgi:hypothetical protein